jgi:hypothetical protein
MAFPQVRGTPVNTVTPLSTTAAQAIDLPSGIQDGEFLLLITNAVSHAMWRVVCAFIVALLAALILTQKPADAQQIKVDCKVYATNYVDPIALAPHLHHLHHQLLHRR